MKRVLKKSLAEQPQTVRQKMEFLADHKHLVKSIERGCKLMNLSRSSYYYKSKNKDISDEALASLIEEIVEEFSGYSEEIG